MYLQPHTALSEYWKENIITSIIPINKEENAEIQSGVVFNPEEFIPHYLLRFITRQEMEGKPLSPGVYEVLMKVKLLVAFFFGQP